MTRHIRAKIVLVILVTLHAGAVTARAEDSNWNVVRDELSRGGWSIAWGKDCIEGDGALGLASIGESVAAEDPGPFFRWFSDELKEDLRKIEANLAGVSRSDLEQWVVQSFRQKRPVIHDNFEIEGGCATYNRWDRIGYDVPAFHGPFNVVMLRYEGYIPLPNWNQFYLRYRFLAPRDSGVTRTVHETTGNGLRRFDVHVGNQTGQRLEVFVRYLDLEGAWKTNKYSLNPGESSRLSDLETRNRYIGFRAEGGDRVWSGGADDGKVDVEVAGELKEFELCHMPPAFGTFTHTFE